MSDNHPLLRESLENQSCVSIQLRWDADWEDCWRCIVVELGSSLVLVRHLNGFKLNGLKLFRVDQIRSVARTDVDVFFDRVLSAEGRLLSAELVPEVNLRDLGTAIKQLTAHFGLAAFVLTGGPKKRAVRGSVRGVDIKGESFWFREVHEDSWEETRIVRTTEVVRSSFGSQELAAFQNFGGVEPPRTDTLPRLVDLETAGNHLVLGNLCHENDEWLLIRRFHNFAWDGFEYIRKLGIVDRFEHYGSIHSRVAAAIKDSAIKDLAIIGSDNPAAPWQLHVSSVIAKLGEQDLWATCRTQSREQFDVGRIIHYEPELPDEIAICPVSPEGTTTSTA